jgi:hypothetical protein
MEWRTGRRARIQVDRIDAGRKVLARSAMRKWEANANE